jgi:hypothetical protein
MITPIHPTYFQKYKVLQSEFIISHKTERIKELIIYGELNIALGK